MVLTLLYVSPVHCGLQLRNVFIQEKERKQENRNVLFLKSLDDKVSGAYEKCKDYLENSQSADAETWAAYESRIRACALLDNKDLEVCSTVFSGETETMKTKWSKLQEMEKKLYLEIITGVKELDEFDRFVEEWMEAGGEQITLEVTEAVREAKGA